MSGARAGGVGVVGLVLIAAVCAAMGKTFAESLQLAGIAGAGALAVGALGALVLRLLARASFSMQVTVVALTSVGAVAAGALAAGQVTFRSGYDLETLVVVVVAAGVVAVLSGLVLANRVGTASASLEAVARSIGDVGGARLVAGGARPTIREFAELAAELDATAARLDEARARQRALDAARRELVSWVSHDLRTPLAGMRAVTEALEDGVVSDPDTVARYYRALRVEAGRLTTLVDDLFELSRINAAALQLELDRVSLGDLLSDAIAAARPVATAKGVRLDGQVRQPAPELELAPPEFTRVLRNLLENAIRETPADGAVSVEAGVDGDQAYVAVSDGCGGIPDTDLRRVFDAGFRSQAARTPRGDGGGGLGLAIARGLVEAHRGVITVENHGRGCRFTVSLPLPTVG